MTTALDGIRRPHTSQSIPNTGCVTALGLPEPLEQRIVGCARGGWGDVGRRVVECGESLRVRSLTVIVRPCRRETEWQLHSGTPPLLKPWASILKCRPKIYPPATHLRFLNSRQPVALQKLFVIIGTSHEIRLSERSDSIHRTCACPTTYRPTVSHRTQTRRTVRKWHFYVDVTYCQFCKVVNDNWSYI